MKKGVGVSHGSQEWGGKSLKHQKQVHGSQEWGGKGLGRRKMKHEKGFGCFMVPKRGVGSGKAKNEA